MNGLTKSLLAKIIAIFLLVITFVSGVGCVGAFAYIMSEGGYDGRKNIWESSVIGSMAYRDALDISNLYWRGNTEAEVNKDVGMGNRNFTYEIYTAYKDGYGPDISTDDTYDALNDYYDNTADERASYNYSEAYEDVTEGSADAEVSRTEAEILTDNLVNGKVPLRAKGPDIGEYVYSDTNYFYYSECVNKVVLKFIRPVSIEDNYYFYYNVINKLYDMKYAIIAIGLVLAIIFIADFVFLMCAAGHRKGTDEIVLNVQDKIPFDLYICIMGVLFALVAGVVMSMGYIDYYYVTGYVIILGTAVVAFAFFAIAASMTIATRIKTGTLIRNTLIFMIISHIVKGLGNFASSITSVWKWLALFCLFCILNVALARRGLLLLAIIDLLALLWFYRTIIGLDRLKRAGDNIAGGNLDAKVDTAKLSGDIKKHAENLNSISTGMSRAVEQKMKSERFRTELITNVSHDIKTPLTSIINYVDLIKKERPEGKIEEYTEILDRQSNRLKKLLDDLLEASKASMGNISVELSKTNVGELVNQAVGEYSERLEKSGIDLIVTLPKEPTYIMADGRKLWRIFDNILSNICKYSLPNTRAYADVVNKGENVVISFKNISKEQLNIDSDELMERFVRGDSSRNTEGSGLGLNIARSFAELQAAKFNLYIDGDLFKAEIIFKRVPADEVKGEPQTFDNSDSTDNTGNTDGADNTEKQ